MHLSHWSISSPIGCPVLPASAFLMNGGDGLWQTFSYGVFLSLSFLLCFPFPSHLYSISRSITSTSLSLSFSGSHSQKYSTQFRTRALNMFHVVACHWLTSYWMCVLTYISVCLCITASCLCLSYLITLLAQAIECKVSFLYTIL